MENEKLLKAEIKDELIGLSELERGSEKYVAAVDGVTKLMDRSIEIERRKQESKRQWIDFGKDCAKFVATVGTFVIWAAASLEFESKGSFTTALGRAVNNLAVPKK